MRLCELHPALLSGLVVLWVLPVLLLMSFLTVGRSRRRRNLSSLGVARQPANKLVAFADVNRVANESFGEYLQRTYDELHAFRNYVLPALVFLLPYGVGLYWSASVLAWLAAPPAEIVSSEGAFLRAASIPLLGFLGGALSALFHLGSRIIRNDVSPRMFHHMALRLAVAPVLAVVIANTVEGLSTEAARVTALMSGFVPVEALRFLTDKISELLSPSPVASGALPLAAIQGIEREDQLRLWEEGVTDTEKLAVESVVSLLVYTNFSLESIIDWKDQAFLYCYAPEDLGKLRALHIRGAMDILGLDEHYYAAARSSEMRDSLATQLAKPRAVIDRFVDTIYNDPRVHQLWEYLKHSYPTEVAKPIIEKFDKLQHGHASRRAGSSAGHAEPS